METSQGKLEVITQYFSEFSPEQLRQLGMLGALYTEWNAKINVISRKDIDALYEKHVLHALSIAACFSFPAGLRIIDIGTGGGFPGIPLAIYFPDVHFHLVDSVGKKIKVVEAIRDALGLRNVTAWHGRAETIRDQRFDFAVSRAVAPLKTLWTWSKPLLNKSRPMPEYKSGLICLKGGDLSAEISESRLRPHVQPISGLFRETYFEDKFLLYVPL